MAGGGMEVVATDVDMMSRRWPERDRGVASEMGRVVVSWCCGLFGCLVNDVSSSSAFLMSRVQAK